MRLTINATKKDKPYIEKIDNACALAGVSRSHALLKMVHWFARDYTVDDLKGIFEYEDTPQAE